MTITPTHPTQAPNAVTAQPAREIIANAIAAANHSANGVVFAPFHMKVVAGTNFTNIWNSERGSKPLTFFQSQGTGPFLPLGDVVHPESANASTWPSYPDAAMLFAPTQLDPGALAHPVEFEWFLDSYGTESNSRGLLHYYRMKPPEGYAALGIAFGTFSSYPDVNRYWCVRKDLLVTIDRQFYWSDDGQGWTKHTGDLWKPVFRATDAGSSDGRMLIIPPVFLSFEDRNREMAYALSVAPATLDVQAPPPEPLFAPHTHDGSETPAGVRNVQVVPFTAVADPGREAPGLRSPFYYVAAQPLWECVGVANTPAGGTYTRTIRIGVAEAQAEVFRNQTTITVSGQIGVAFRGVGAQVSKTLTQEFELVTATGSATETVIETKNELPLPKAKSVSIWEGRTDISVYRTDGRLFTNIRYANRDTRLVTQPD